MRAMKHSALQGSLRIFSLWDGVCFSSHPPTLWHRREGHIPDLLLTMRT